jgi:hypothetical protein
MTRTVTAMFDRYQDAAEAVTRLEAAGIPHSAISIVSNDATHRNRAEADSTATRHNDTEADTGAGTGATLGTALGGGAGLLAGLGMLAIPGLGPVVAAGWLASTLVGAGAGAAAGGLLGALAGAGIDDSDAHSYAEAIHRGGTLVTVRTDEAHYARVVDILDDEGTVDMNQRESSWRQEGWGGRYAGADYGPGTTGAMSTGPVGAAASMTTGLGTGAVTDAPSAFGGPVGTAGSGVAGDAAAGLRQATMGATPSTTLANPQPAGTGRRPDSRTRVRVYGS